MIKLSDAAKNYLRIKTLGTPYEVHTKGARVMVWVYENDFYVVNEKDLEAVESMVAKSKPMDKEEEKSTDTVTAEYNKDTCIATFSFMTNTCEFERLFEYIMCNVNKGACHGCMRCSEGSE